MLKFAEKNGIPKVDISVDRNIAENTNRPYDAHPSAVANRKYAEKLERFLRPRVSAGGGFPGMISH